jgi:hypothetical protein
MGFLFFHPRWLLCLLNQLLVQDCSWSVFFLSCYEIFELCIGVVSVVSYGDYYGWLARKKKKMIMLSLLCVIFAWVIERNGSEACSVIDSVLSLEPLLKLSIMAFQSSKICADPTYGFS